MSALAIRCRPEQGHHDQAGQTHFPAYTKLLLEKVEAGLNDPGVVLTHPAGLKHSPKMHPKERDKKDGVISARWWNDNNG